eukprot:886983-Amphidinium_carterae.1
MQELKASPTQREALQGELDLFGAGPQKELAAKTAARTEWFNTWLAALPTAESEGPRKLPDSKKKPKGERPFVLVAAAEVLQAAMEKTPAVVWDPDYAVLCESLGQVVKEDESCEIAKVKFPAPHRMSVWLPRAALLDPAANDAVEGGDPATGGGGEDPEENNDSADNQTKEATPSAPKPDATPTPQGAGKHRRTPTIRELSLDQWTLL